MALVALPAAGEEDGRRFSIHPALRITTVFNDNVYFDKHDPHSDFGAWFEPQVELRYRARSWEVGSDLGADIRRYTDSSSLDDEFFRVRGFGELGLLPGLALRVSDIYVPQPVTLGLPEDQSNNLKQTNRTNAELRYWREFSGGREVEAGLRGTYFLSDSFPADVPAPGGGTVVDPHFDPDYWEAAFYTEVQNPLGRHNNLWARSQVRYRTFDQSAESDFVDFAFLGGIRSSWHDKLEFEVAGGYGFIDYLDRGNKHRALGRLKLTQRFTGGWSWTLSAENRFTADLAGQDFVESTGRLTLEKSFGERTSASISGFASRFEGDGWGGDADVYAGAEAKVRRQLTRRVQLELRYRYWFNGGGYGTDDFEQNWLGLQFTYRR